MNTYWCNFECNFNVPWFNQLLSWGSILGCICARGQFLGNEVIFVKFFNVECLGFLNG
jgi:hypothetical protein